MLLYQSRLWAPAFAGALLALVTLLDPTSARAADSAFRDWLQSLWQEAEMLGVSRATFEGAIHDLEPDLSLPDLIIPGRPEAPPPGQAEFVQTPSEYLRELTLAHLAAQGRELYDQHKATLLQIERKFGVPPYILLAIWGRETAFGTAKLKYDAIRVLATQGFYGQRKDFFRNEFLLALKMLEEGVNRADMRSSWGGAMGMIQLLPSEYFKNAIDFDGDGRRDIWHSVPDALASAAKQLADRGWQPGKHWALEVLTPAGVDCTIANPDYMLTLAEWIRRGFILAHNRKAGTGELDERASLLMPAGVYGPAFLIFRNYYVIKDYNFSDLYVLFVGNLSDRIAGASAFETPWANLVQLNTKDLEEIQQRLITLGFYSEKIDGKAGMRTRLAVGSYQKANGLTLDCWPSPAVLEHLRTRR